MLHDLPRRLVRHTAGRRAFMTIVAGFLCTQLALSVRPWLPGQTGTRLPWTMFVATGKNNRSLTFSGVTEADDIVEIDPTRWVRFTRGFTNLRIYDHHPAMWKDKPRHKRNQRVFARWLARELWLADGTRLREVRFQRHWERIASGEVKHGQVHRIAITAQDLTRAVPLEAKVGGK